MTGWEIGAAIYLVGAVFTFLFNVGILAFVSNWGLIWRNVLLWPFFLPVLIIVWRSER